MRRRPPQLLRGLCQKLAHRRRVVLEGTVAHVSKGNLGVEDPHLVDDVNLHLLCAGQ